MARMGVQILSAGWREYSKLILVSDQMGWSLDWDSRELKKICKSLNIQTIPSYWKSTKTPQSIYYTDHYMISKNEDWLEYPHRIGISFPEGVTIENNTHPVFESLSRHHSRIDRVQVSHKAMFDYVTRSGIESKKVFVIPIGINLSFFHFQNMSLRVQLRKKLGIPQNAFVIGSFQKDGQGWGSGMEPKWVKGPDVFYNAIKKIQKEVPDLMVLLVGPARGYLISVLEHAGVRWMHIPKTPYPEIGRLFTVLDLYIVASRHEGGPKAILESMASGVPLVTTRVGQAMDLVKHGKNAFMVNVEDVDALAFYALQVFHSSQANLQSMLLAGRKTAEANSYESQIPLWAEFMKGFVE